MNITRERYMDDGPESRVMVSFQTGSARMHSLSSDLDEASRAKIGDVLVRALDDIELLLRPHLQGESRPETTAFGCGT